MSKLLSERNGNDNDILSQSLDELARKGAQKLLAHALELEVRETIDRSLHLKDENGHRRVVRNGKGKARKLTFGGGTVEVEAPRVHDRGEGPKFESRILPRYARRSPGVEAVLPLLYLKGLSGNAFYDALKGLLGEGVSGLSKSSVCSLKKSWAGEMHEWKKRKIDEEFVYLWADGVNVNIRLGGDKKLCLLVVMGVNSAGEKRLLALEGGHRESSESWRVVFRSLIARGLNAPGLLIGDGALGLWSALGDIPEFKETKGQRCWVHKNANVLDRLPKKLRPQAKSLLHEMMNAAEEKDAEVSRDVFEKSFADKYPKAVDCLLKDWDKLTPFFSFPGAHWRHIRTTNPIESTFATVKLRTAATKGSGSTEMAEAMAFKLMAEAQKRWKRIRGHGELKNILSGVLYKDGKLCG